MKKPMASTSLNQTDPIRDSGEDDEHSSEEAELERALADIPFEDLQRARADGSHSVWFKPAAQEKFGRANKNRPMEISSKVRVGRFREVIQAPKRVIRDPRFESLSGNVDTEGFRKRYDFLFETELPAEKEKLQKLVKKSKDPKVIEELKNHISWIDKQLKSVVTKKKARPEVLKEYIKKEREATKQGKRPYYLKQSEIRKMELTEKFNELKAAGKLESFMVNRRRKNAAKDHRYMPYRRSGENTDQ